jgi:murein L,D-transpeptidase YcbB/YkuD
LAEYRALREKGGWEALPPGTTLRKGMMDQRIPALRKRLAMTDALLDSTDPMVFDESLEQAVIRFQRRHGLKEDGVVGRNVLDALNVPAEERIDQIRVNLERARWVLRHLDDTFVLVDIAGFRVFFQKNNQIVWSCKAQVGRPYRDTPVFKSRITHVEINPTWVVPPTIFEKDILPGIRKDRRYLKKKNITVLDGKGRPVNPLSINWSLYPRQHFPFTLRQDPGKNNALGRIKIMFPNKYFVYLHDTPHKELFAQEERTFSSGCIRIEKPFELAELLLGDPDIWNQAGFMKAVRSERTRTVFLPGPVTILLLYWTVEVDDDGVIYFKRDPYNRDREVLEGLGRDAEITPAIKN